MPPTRATTRTATLGVCAAVLLATLGAPVAAGAAAEPSNASPAAVVEERDHAPRGTDSRGRKADCVVSEILVPSCGSWWGAFSLNEGAESPADAIRSLEAYTDEPVDVVHYYFRHPQVFPPSWLIDLAREPGQKRLLLMNWKPEGTFTWRQVADGAADAYIDQEADYLREYFREPFFLTIRHEPEEEVIQVPGSGYTAMDYSDMYRHIVDRLRAKGVDNAIYVMNYMGFQGWGLQDWFPDLYPGDRYVDWIAFDPYASSGLGDQDRGFRFMMNSYWGSTDWRGAYRYFTRHHPGKPIMLGEWGIGEKAGDPDWKADFFQKVGKRLGQGNFPMLKGLFYFDNRYGAASGDVRVDTSLQAVEAMKDLLDKPVWAPPPT